MQAIDILVRQYCDLLCLIIKYSLILTHTVLCYIALPQKMDKNKDGVVTLEEFVIACQEVRIVIYWGTSLFSMQ